MNTLPFQGFDGRGPVGQFNFDIACRAIERSFNIVRVGRLGKVMASAQLDRLNRGRNTGKAGQHHDEHVGIVRMQCLHTGQARRFAVEFEVHHRKFGAVDGEKRNDFRMAGGVLHGIASPLK